MKIELRPIAIREIVENYRDNAEEGVLGYPMGARHTRFVWHLDVDDELTERATHVLTGLLRRRGA